jgi:hypothetical protein
MGTKFALLQPMKSLSTFALLASLLGGCPTAPPDLATTLDVEVEISIEDFSSEIIISTAFFSFSEIELLSDVNVGGYDLDAVQIVSSESDGDFLFEDIPPALYSRMKLKLNKPNASEELPEAFNDEPLSFLIEGTALIGGQPVPLRVQDSRPVPNMSVVLLQGVDVLPGNEVQLALKGQISQLFVGVALDNIQPTDLTDGALLIDLSDQPFLNDHPSIQEIATLVDSNLEIVFTVLPSL